MLFPHVKFFCVEMNLLCNWRVIYFVYVSKNFAVLFADDKCVLFCFQICS